ncbi:ABC transporter family substrate-binding protein [Aeromicrobium sp. UC242_57]|uniref:ABC transporter family substrate-binding protein n=1 Tax=Aeromicrobium sp. UC242_57 TaxID=3374624 RepID=UPI0037A50BD5
MRFHVTAAASFLLAGSLALSGCSLLSGSDDAAPDPTPSSTKPVSTALPSTAWSPAPAADVAQGGTLRLAATMLPTNFNPLQADSANSDAARILAPTTGGAVRITADGGWTVDPDYARSVKVVDEDPLTIEVRLNRDAVWQGGTSITAADMVAFWKAQNGSDDAYEVTSTAGYDAISAVTPSKSKFTYTVTFKKPTADWPQYIYPRLAANASSSAKLFNTGFRKRAISSNGPYIVRSIDTRKGVITLTRNPRWWGAPPKLAKITWNIADSALQAKAFANGELDAVDLDATTPDAVSAVKDVGTVQKAAGAEWSQITLNGGRGPLADEDVRRAVAMAINRQPIAQQAAAGLKAPAAPLGSLLLVPGQKGYRDSSASIAYDPAAAEKLLAKAGYTKNASGLLERKGKPLTLRLPVPRETPTNAARAKLIVADLAKVGITVEVRDAPTGVDFYNQVVVPLDFDLVTFVRRASPFPLTSAAPRFFPLDSAQNFTGLGPARIGQGFDTVIGTLDDELRLKRIAKLDEWLFDEVAVVPLAVTPLATAVGDRLVNYGAAQFEQPDWTTVGYLTKKDE